MKQLLTLVICLITTTAYAQEDTVTLVHTGYTSLYSKILHYPLMVQWWDTRDRVSCNNPLPRKDAFGPDPLLKKETDLNADYKGSGYDRGHMSPAADNECSGPVELMECFYFSNMIPQPHSENAGQWKELETFVRGVASRLDSCYIWAGGIGIYNSYTNGALIGQNVSGNYYVAGGGCGGGYSTGGGSFGCGGGSSYAGGGGGGHAGGSNLAGSNGGVGAAIVATLSAATSSTICIGSTYVTQDTCIIWYWNGSQYVNRGTYNSSYNQTNCSMYTGYGALSSSINTVGFTNLSANTGVGNIGIGAYAGQKRYNR